MLKNKWKIGDFFYVPQNLKHNEYFGVFTEHGSVLIKQGEDGSMLVCSEHGITNPMQNSTPLEWPLYSNNHIVILIAIHAATMGKLPYEQNPWLVPS